MPQLTNLDIRLLGGGFGAPVGANLVPAATTAEITHYGEHVRVEVSVAINWNSEPKINEKVYVGGQEGMEAFAQNLYYCGKRGSTTKFYSSPEA